MGFSLKRLLNPKTLLGTLLLGPIGGAVGYQLAGGDKKAAAGPAPFAPSRQAQKELPSSLQGFGSLSPDQQASNIATQGTFGTGLGPQEQDYFLNLVNRQLVDETGGVQDLNTLNPIQNSYLSNLGLGGQSNSRNLLEAISKWKAA